MPLPVAFAVAKTQAFAEGEKILGQLFKCKIKPKGTPHGEVYLKTPKFFYTYGAGIPGAAGFTSPSEGAFIHWHSGKILTLGEFDAMLPQEDRRKLEVTARKPCEDARGVDRYLFVEVRPSGEFKGFIRLNDGSVYDATVYGLQGSSRISSAVLTAMLKPLPTDLSRISSSLSGNGGASVLNGKPIKASTTAGVGGLVLGGLLLMGLFGGVLKGR